MMKKKNGSGPRLIKKIRIALGFSQRQMGIRLLVSQSAVAHWESGYNIPAAPMALVLTRLAATKKINVTIEDVRGES